MADKFINETGLVTIRDWIKNKFALDSDLDALEDKVDDIIAEGGEPNVIEVVQKNGTALPVSNKTVNVTVPTTVAELSDASDYALADDIPTKLSELTNDGDGTQGSKYATEAYVDTNGGKIDVIKVNGTTQTITNKTVDLTVPTKVSDLTNDSGFQTAADVTTTLANNGDPYQTESDVDDKIAEAVTSVYVYKGSVPTYNDLPASGNKTGDVWDVQATGINYAWTGTDWDALGAYVDTSVLWTSVTGQTNTLEAMTVAEINAILEPTNP